MIDVEGILSKFAEVATEPTYSPALSVDPDSLIKNVFQERPEDTPKPNYPYIVLDLTAIEQENGWEINQYVDDNDNTVYETNYELLLSYHVYGSGARAIANQLEGYFRFERVRNDVEKTTGGVIVQTLPIQSLPQQLSDKFIDSAIFTLLFAVTDSQADTQSTIIDQVDIDGELHRYVGDPDPLEADISVNQNP